MSESSDDSGKPKKDIKTALQESMSSIFYVFLEVMFSKTQDDSSDESD